MIRPLLLSGALALGMAVAAAPLVVTAQPTSAAAMPPGAMPTDAMGYVMAAGQSDQFEIQSGDLASAQGGSRDVRSFGEGMHRDHTKSTMMVMAAAKKAGMSPPSAPPPLRPDQMAMLDQLRPLRGADFDRVYVQQQMKAHDEALMLQQNYAQNGDTPALKMAASQIVPVVQMHRSMLAKMNP